MERFPCKHFCQFITFIIVWVLWISHSSVLDTSAIWLLQLIMGDILWWPWQEIMAMLQNGNFLLLFFMLISPEWNKLWCKKCNLYIAVGISCILLTSMDYKSSSELYSLSSLSIVVGKKQNFFLRSWKPLRTMVPLFHNNTYLLLNIAYIPWPNSFPIERSYNFFMFRIKCTCLAWWGIMGMTICPSNVDWITAPFISITLIVYLVGWTVFTGAMSMKNLSEHPYSARPLIVVCVAWLGGTLKPQGLINLLGLEPNKSKASLITYLYSHPTLFFIHTPHGDLPYCFLIVSEARILASWSGVVTFGDITMRPEIFYCCGISPFFLSGPPADFFSVPVSTLAWTSIWIDLNIVPGQAFWRYIEVKGLKLIL